VASGASHLRILSLDGGGYLGLAGAAYLAELERHFNTTCHREFDLFCGTSTGAIIALALASGKTARQVCDLYKDFGPRVFNNPFPGSRLLRKFKGFVTSRYGNQHLRTALRGAFGDETLGSILRQRKFVVVPAFCLTTGRPRVFKTDHAEELTRHNGYLLRDVALASSAAPIYLPVAELRSPVESKLERYCDGGVFANYPALLGLTEALYQFKTPPAEIRLLSVSTPRSNLAEDPCASGFFRRRMLSRGICFWASSIGSVFIDSTSEIAGEAVRRLISSIGASEDQYERVVFRRPKGVDLDIASADATQALESIGTEEAAKGEVRGRMRKFFATKGVVYG